jgi:ribose transport system permease protein
MNRSFGATARRLAASPFKWVWIATVALYLVMLLATPNAATGLALITMMPFAGMLAVATLGQAVVMMQRGFDFSLAGIVAMSSIVVARLTHEGTNPAAAIAVTLLVCVACGVVNGIVVSWLALPPLVATLASNGLFLGLGYLIANGVQVQVSDDLTHFATAKVGGLAVSAWIALAAVLLLLVLIRLTTFGRRFIAVGSNPQAAHAAGLPVTMSLVSAYAIAGLCFGIAGVLISGFVGMGSLAASGSYLMGSLSALMVAGGAVGGVRASLVAAVVGALFMTLLTQFVLALGASAAVQNLIQGLVLISAVALPDLRLPRFRRAATG